MTAVTGRGWETVPISNPSINSQLVGLRQNTPTDYTNIRFPIARITANPSNNLYWGPNQFIQNGAAVDGSAVITGLGSTSRMYVGMTVLGSTFPVVTIVSIDSDTQITVSGTSRNTAAVTLTFNTDREGDNSNGATGNITRPFADYAKARQRAVELGAGQGNSFNLIFLGNTANLGAFVISPYVNIDFNGAVVSFDSITQDGRWEDADSQILIQNGQIISSIALDFTTASETPTAKQLFFKNILINSGSVDLSFTGNGNENFFLSNDTSTSYYTLYANSLDFINFNAHIDAFLSLNNPINTTTNTSSSGGTTTWIEQELYQGVNVTSESGALPNNLVARALINAPIVVDGVRATFQPNVVSNCAVTLVNGGNLDDYFIRRALWPMAAATAAPGAVAGPGGTAVLSGVASLDNFGTFVPNSNYGIPQTGQYEFEYMAQISVNDAGNFDTNLYIAGILPSAFVDEHGNPIPTINADGEPIVATTDYANSIVREQATVTTPFKMTLCGSVSLDNLPVTQQMILMLKNNGDMDITVDSATWSIKRVY